MHRLASCGCPSAATLRHALGVPSVCVKEKSMTETILAVAALICLMVGVGIGHAIAMSGRTMYNAYVARTKVLKDGTTVRHVYVPKSK